MKLAIVGSRSLEGNAEAERLIGELLDTCNATLLVSGGAIGIDRMAERIAKARGIPTLILKPATNRWAPNGFMERNKRIAEECDYLVCIMGVPVTSHGSAWTADYARSIKRPVEEYLITLPAAMTGARVQVVP